MSSPSSPNNDPVRRGKTTFHNMKATPKMLRPVQPQHVYDYEDEHEARRSREERKPRRSSAPADMASFGMFAFFGVLLLGVVFYLVQGASTMPFESVGDTRDEVIRKNEETRRLNEQRAREAALHPQPQPVQRETPVIPATRMERTPAPVPAATPAPAKAPVPNSAFDPMKRPERPSPLGGISAGMLPAEVEKKTQNEAPKPPQNEVQK